MKRTARRLRPIARSRHLHSVPRSLMPTPAPRPHWWSLYIGVAMPLAGAIAAHALLAAPPLGRAADAGATALAFAWLFWWIHVNKAALGPSDQPARRPTRPGARIVRSRELHACAPRRNDSPPPGAILPYDFR